MANGETSKATHVTQLPLPQLSQEAAKANTFKKFSASLMSVGKTSDNCTISVFTRRGVTVHTDKYVGITYKGEPILIGVRDKQRQYCIPLMEQRRQWQPQQPSRKAKKALNEANSRNNLPSTEQAIKWMHAVCGYPVKSTWLKAVEERNYIGWPMLNTRNIKKYYPETTKLQKVI